VTPPHVYNFLAERSESRPTHLQTSLLGRTPQRLSICRCPPFIVQVRAAIANRTRRAQMPHRCDRLCLLDKDMRSGPDNAVAMLQLIVRSAQRLAVDDANHTQRGGHVIRRSNLRIASLRDSDTRTAMMPRRILQSCLGRPWENVNVLGGISSYEKYGNCGTSD
jgi:hypothetical protein